MSYSYNQFSNQGINSPPAVNHGKAWSATDLTDLRQMVKKQYEITAIARHLGRTESAVQIMMANLGIGEYNYSSLPATKEPTDMDIKLTHLLTLLQEHYTTVNVMLLYAGGSKFYTYKVSNELAATLVKDDMVVVPVNEDEYKLAKVVEVHPEPQIDVRSPYTLKWVIQKVDLTNHQAQVARETAALEVLRKERNKKAREEALKELLGNTSVEELRSLLAGK